MSRDGSRISEIPADKLTADQSAVVEAVQRGRGFLPKPFLVWLHSPKVAEHMEGLGTFLNTSSSLSQREFEIAVVIVARGLHSPFVFDAHLKNLARAGHPAAVVDALRDGKVPELASERERLVYEIATTAGDPEPASDALYDEAVSVLGREGLADLIALIGYYTAVALAMKIHRIPVAPR